MKIPYIQAGEATIYGKWDDVQDYQFIVIWGEAGDTCTVLILSGQDYGGGVTIFSSSVPLKEAEDIVSGDYESLYEPKRLMELLVAESGGKSCLLL